MGIGRWKGCCQGGAASWSEKVLSGNVLSEQTPEEVNGVSDAGPMFSSMFLCCPKGHFYRPVLDCSVHKRLQVPVVAGLAKGLNLSCEGWGKGCSSYEFLAPGSLDGAATAHIFCFCIPQNLVLPPSVASSL